MYFDFDEEAVITEQNFEEAALNQIDTTNWRDAIVTNDFDSEILAVFKKIHEAGSMPGYTSPELTDELKTAAWDFMMKWYEIIYYAAQELADKERLDNAIASAEAMRDSMEDR